MQYLPLIILLAFVSVLSILIDRRHVRNVAAAARESAPADNLVADPAATTAPTERTGVLTRLTNQWSRRFGRKPPLPDDPVRVWLASIFVENPAECAWFASLPPEQFAVLRRELADFCAELGFDLIWLVEQATYKPAVLEQAGKTIVTHFCRAVLASVQVHDDLKALQRYQAFLTNPTGKENLAFGQQLYAGVVSEKLARAATAELMMADEKERQSFAVQAIQTAAEENDVAFSAVLKAVVLGAAQPRPAASNTMPPVMQNGVVAAGNGVG